MTKDSNGRLDELETEHRRRVAEREAVIVPRIKAALLTELQNRPTASLREKTFLTDVASLVEALPSTDLRFRILASFVDLAVISMFEDYFLYYLGGDRSGWMAFDRYFEEHEQHELQDPDEFLYLLLLDVVASEAASP